jgi:hypothetical protein
MADDQNSNGWGGYAAALAPFGLKAALSAAPRVGRMLARVPGMAIPTLASGGLEAVIHDPSKLTNAVNGHNLATDVGNLYHHLGFGTPAQAAKPPVKLSQLVTGEYPGGPHDPVHSSFSDRFGPVAGVQPMSIGQYAPGSALAQPAGPPMPSPRPTMQAPPGLNPIPQQAQASSPQQPQQPPQDTSFFGADGPLFGATKNGPSFHDWIGGMGSGNSTPSGDQGGSSLINKMLSYFHKSGSSGDTLSDRMSAMY